MHLKLVKAFVNGFCNRYILFSSQFLHFHLLKEHRLTFFKKSIPNWNVHNWDIFLSCWKLTRYPCFTFTKLNLNLYDRSWIQKDKSDQFLKLLQSLVSISKQFLVRNSKIYGRVNLALVHLDSICARALKTQNKMSLVTF